MSVRSHGYHQLGDGPNVHATSIVLSPSRSTETSLTESTPIEAYPNWAEFNVTATDKRGQKRGIEYAQSSPRATYPASKRKVSRACDFCKSRKAKCSGTQPCEKCVAKGRACLYEAKYTRGRPQTPPQSEANGHSLMRGEESSATLTGMDPAPVTNESENCTTELLSLRKDPRLDESVVPSRASPELGMAEIEGQIFDPTSSLTFLHRAWKRLSTQGAQAESGEASSCSEKQLITTAGDKPLTLVEGATQGSFPSLAEAKILTSLYFEVCIATYHFLHRPSFETWLTAMARNLAEDAPVWRDVGHAKAAIVYAALSMARLHQEKSKGLSAQGDDAEALQASDALFAFSAKLTEEEMGFPKLESAQARLVQVLYLLSTSRFNRGWYAFGNALQIISALGLQRRVNWRRQRALKKDYIQKQCCIRTFWTAYILDNYLGGVFGRPRHFHDDDIDQDLPDRVNDDDMTPSGPLDHTDSQDGYHIDALLSHARIAQIIGCISREVYTIKAISDQDRIDVARKLIEKVGDWRQNLPLHLGSIPPSMLIPRYRRQSTVLKLAHSHAIMHANRLFLLRKPIADYDIQTRNCITAAQDVLETVDRVTREGPVFHAFWWTHYVTFCALVVTYVWEIQQFRNGNPPGRESRRKLMDLAQKCHTHLKQATAANSPSRRYAVILDEFRNAANSQSRSQNANRIFTDQGLTRSAGNGGRGDESRTVEFSITPARAHQVEMASQSLPTTSNIDFLDEWQLTDWLDLDSSGLWSDFNLAGMNAWSPVV